MSASLVGSEMCIRDSCRCWPPRRWGCCRSRTPGSTRTAPRPERPSRRTVSYTHLTLPTICSV
eukprot:7747478-Alexandrium_andersonii.AAC.1